MLNFDYTLDSELKAPVGELPSGIQTQAFSEALTRLMRKYHATMKMLARPVVPLKVPAAAGFSPIWKERIKAESAFIQAAVHRLNQIARTIVLRGTSNAVLQGALDSNWDRWSGHALQSFSQALASFEGEVSRAMSNAVTNGTPASFVKLATVAKMTVPTIPDVKSAGMAGLPMQTDDKDYGLGEINPMVLGAVAGASLIGLAAWWFARPTPLGYYDY
jgi:hypothetical protein